MKSSNLKRYQSISVIELVLGWILLVALVPFVFGYIKAQRHSTSFGLSHSLWIIERDDELSVVDLHEIEDIYPDSRIYIQVMNAPGPWSGLGIEFYETKSLTWDIATIEQAFSSDEPVQYSDLQLIEIDNAILQHIRLDRDLDEFKVNAPPVTVFSFERALNSALKYLIILGIPSITVYALKRFDDLLLKRSITKLRNAGLCVHCTYDCNNLPSTTCPECGQPHTTPIESPIIESHA